MSITVFFPKAYSWQDAGHFVAERQLPVAMLSPDSIFAGKTFARYCAEIDLDRERGAMIYHRENVQLRKDGQ